MSWLLLKIPVTLATTFYATSLINPPQPKPQTHEQDRVRGLGIFARFIQGRNMSLIVPVVKQIPTVVGCVDAIFTFAHIYRETPLGATALSIICPTPNAAHAGISPAYVMATLVVIVSSSIRERCYHELGEHFTFELSIRDDHKLVKTGPYAVVRHPSYTAAVPLMVGLTFWGVSPGSWLVEAGILHTATGRVLATLWAAVLAFAVVCVARAPREDAAMFIPWVL